MPFKEGPSIGPWVEWRRHVVDFVGIFDLRRSETIT